LHLFLWAVVTQATDLSNFSPTNGIKGQVYDLCLCNMTLCPLLRKYLLKFRKSLLSPSSRSKKLSSQNTGNLLYASIKETEAVNALQCLDKIAEKNDVTSYTFCTWETQEFRSFIFRNI
jgi:hypothetical protein